MTFIDWSDADEMLGLLAEYVADERTNAFGDPERAQFLGDLARELEGLGDRASAEEVIEKLQAIADSQPADFVHDDVLIHVRHCIEELERIQSQTA
jgi:hypothetical protein